MFFLCVLLIAGMVYALPKYTLIVARYDLDVEKKARVKKKLNNFLDRSSNFNCAPKKIEYIHTGTSNIYYVCNFNTDQLLANSTNLITQDKLDVFNAAIDATGKKFKAQFTDEPLNVLSNNNLIRVDDLDEADL